MTNHVQGPANVLHDEQAKQVCEQDVIREGGCASGTRARVGSKPGCVAAQVAAALVEQAVAVVESVSDETFRRESKSFAGGTIGKHFRHCLDHFAAALVAAQESGAVIEYDRRRRNVPMETCRVTAAAALRSVMEQLREVESERGSLPVRVRVMLTGDGEEVELSSTLARELAFAAHHAVHHHAMIKAIGEEFGERMPSEFGKAPSTINYERSGRGSGS